MISDNKELLGKHQFSGIETGYMDYVDEYNWKNSNCQYVKFTLDGINYVAVEDPEDGYRSCCGVFQTDLTPPKFSFDPIEVICSFKPDDTKWYDKNDILVITDAVTNKIILEIGTRNWDNWYPCFHFEYHPEDMACNN